MDEFGVNPTEEDDLVSDPETPEDVAVLYTWANVHGGKYRDFSASRREFRAQQRHRMVEAQRQAELEAARQREEQAARELEAAFKAEAASEANSAERVAAEENRRRAEEHAEQEHQAALRHVETAEELKRAMEQAQREMEEARHRAEEQSARYAEADARWRAQQQDPKGADAVPGEINDPYYFAGPQEPSAFAPGGGVRSSMPQRVASERRIAESYYRSRGEHGAETDNQSGARPMLREGGVERRRPVERRIETPGDRRERRRPDELDRRNPTPRGGQFDDNVDDGYYDRSMQDPSQRPVQAARTPADLNSTQSDLHIPPQAPQSRAVQDSGGYRVRRSEDPLPGNTHPLDTERRRRRGDSVVDETARTTRRPRETASYATQGHLEPERRAAPRHDAEQRAPREGAEALPGYAPAADSHIPRKHYDDNLPPARLLRPESDAQHPGAVGPAWVVRDARGNDQAAAGQYKADERRRQNDVFEEFLAKTDAAPRHGEERPTRSTYMERGHDDQRPAIDAGEPSFEERAARRREERRNRPPAGLTRETPIPRGADERDSQTIRAADGGFNLRPMRDRAPVDSLPPLGEAGLPVAPAAARQADQMGGPREERRRYDRGTGLHGVEAQLDSSRELRAAARAAEQEERETSRFQGTRREALPREETLLEAPVPAASTDNAERTLQPGSDRQQEARNAFVPPHRPISSIPLPAVDTLQQSRERVAARWFALKGLMGSTGDSSTQQEAFVAPRSSKEVAAPVLSVVSLSGGVGKTSLVATLGRALSAVGEKVLLADTTAHGLLPYYFGARELRPDVVRTFSPPPGSMDAPVFMVNYQTDRLIGDEAGQDAMVEEIARHARGTHRALLDLNGSSAWLARRLARFNASVLVPIAPDMNSVLGIQAVERFFAGTQDSDGRPVQPYYVLNQFDASMPLHLDVREVLRRQLGDRLLPAVIRRSQSVSEALAEGMTVIDYVPESPVTEDYINLAQWVRSLAPPASTGKRNIRWSEQ